MFKRLIVSKTMRQRVSWLIAIVLILPLVMFFHANVRPPKGEGGTAGIVFGKPVDWDTFQLQRNWIEQQFQNQFGRVPDTMQPLVSQYAWDRLILLAEARRRHLRVDDRELADFIRTRPAFQEKGHFVPERYAYFLRASRATPQTFERLLRDELTVEKLIDSVKATVALTDDEVRTAYTRLHERRQAVVIVYESSAYSAEAASGLAEETLHAEYAAHPDAVRAPEQLMMEYAGASREELAAHVTVTDQELHDSYQDHQDQFAKSDGTIKPFEEVRDLVKQYAINERVNKQLTALALDLSDDVDARLRFEEIVTSRALTSHTAGPLSTDSLTTPKEDVDAAVLEALAKLPEGKLSDVIRTDQGVYVGRITRRMPSHIPPFAEVRATLRNRLIQQRARELAHQHATSLQTSLKERLAAGLRFEEAALAYGVLPAHIATFTRSEAIDPIGHVPSVNEAAFAASLGRLSDVLETPKGFVIVRPETHLPADLSSFATAQATVRQDLLTQKQSARLEAWLAEIRSRAKLQSFVDATPPAPQRAL